MSRRSRHDGKPISYTSQAIFLVSVTSHFLWIDGFYRSQGQKRCESGLNEGALSHMGWSAGMKHSLSLGSRLGIPPKPLALV